MVLGSGGNVHFEWRANGKELEVELKGDAIDFIRVTPEEEIIEGVAQSNVPQEMSRLTQWLMLE